MIVMNLNTIIIDERYRFSFLSGLSACCSSLFGKLSGKLSIDSHLYETLLKVALICLMFVSGAAVWTFFVKALQRSTTTIVPTLISTATNYILSALFGFLIFGEQLTVLWVCGMTLVTSGLILVTKSSNTNTEHLKEYPSNNESLTYMKKTD